MLENINLVLLDSLLISYPVFQALLSKLPAGDSMIKDLVAQLKSNTTKHGYDDSISKALNQELHVVTEKASSLKTGLKGWQDKLKRLLDLNKNHRDEMQNTEASLKKTRAVLDEAEKRKYETSETKFKEVEKMREKCQVRHQNKHKVK